MLLPVDAAKVMSASFPSAAKLGERYSNRFGSLPVDSRPSGFSIVAKFQR